MNKFDKKNILYFLFLVLELSQKFPENGDISVNIQHF